MLDARVYKAIKKGNIRTSLIIQFKNLINKPYINNKISERFDLSRHQRG